MLESIKVIWLNLLEIFFEERETPLDYNSAPNAEVHSRTEPFTSVMVFVRYVTFGNNPRGTSLSSVTKLTRQRIVIGGTR
jgi:hypothetical protein